MIQHETLPRDANVTIQQLLRESFASFQTSSHLVRARSPLPSTRPLHPVPSHSGGAMQNVCCYWTSTCRHCDEPQTSLLVCLEDKPALELRLLFAPSFRRVERLGVDRARHSGISLQPVPLPQPLPALATFFPSSQAFTNHNFVRTPNKWEYGYTVTYPPFSASNFTTAHLSDHTMSLPPPPLLPHS